MAVLITGSVATDHLMTFPGKFADSIVADKLDKISLSFLVEELDVRRGGVAPNIAFGMGCLGLRPVLVGAVGPERHRHPIGEVDARVDRGHVGQLHDDVALADGLDQREQVRIGGV